MSASTLYLSPEDAHELWAASYDENPNPVLALEERIVKPLLPSLDGAHVLDVACGTGRWLRHLVRSGASGVGLDVSHAMLQQAARKADLGDRLVEADAQAIPLADASIDFAICSFGLSYIRELEAFVKELSRAVKVGGSIVLTDLHPSAYARGWKRSFRHNGAVVEIASFQRSLASILQTFNEHGFRRLAVAEAEFGEPERPIFEKAGKGDLWESARGQPAIYACVFCYE